MEAWQSEFRDKLKELINEYSRENGSDTPDFILAGYMDDCLAAFDAAVTAREKWYGRLTAASALEAAREKVTG